MATAHDQDEPAQRENATIVREARYEAALAIQTYNRARRDGRVNLAVRKELAQAALDYRDALYEYRIEDALSQPWDERGRWDEGLDWIESAVDQSVDVEKDLGRRNGNTEPVTRPKLLAVDPRELRDTIRELNDVAKELGFSREAKSGTHRAEIDDELMQKYHEWHKQHTN